jgi:small subunit ribosomal protein S16
LKVAEPKRDKAEIFNEALKASDAPAREAVTKKAKKDEEPAAAAEAPAEEPAEAPAEAESTEA